MRSNIILFPEFEKLKTEISSLKARISELLCMRDQMLFVECKNIEMEYMLALGDLEYKAYELNCHMLRLKRRADTGLQKPSGKDHPFRDREYP